MSTVMENRALLPQVTEINQMTKEDLTAKLVQTFTDGFAGVADAATLAKMVKVFTKVLADPDVQNELSAELNRHGGKMEENGMKISEVERGVRWDFKNCRHPELDQLYAIQESVKKGIKLFENQLKAGQTEFVVNKKYSFTAHDIPQEIVTCNSPVKSGKLVISIA